MNGDGKRATCFCQPIPATRGDVLSELCATRVGRSAPRMMRKALFEGLTLDDTPMRVFDIDEYERLVQVTHEQIE
jgi:hypothetical protein